MNDSNNPNPSSNPTTWPGAFGIYSKSREAVMLNINALIICIAISIGASIVFEMFFGANNSSLPSLLSYLVGLIITPVTAVLYINGIKGQKISPKDSFDFISNNLMNIVLTQIVVAALSALSFMFFIIPYFFVGPKLSLAMYYAVNQKMEVGDALKASWNNTTGHVGKIYGIIGVYLLIALLVITIIGIPFAIYLGFMYSASIAVLYSYIDDQKFQAINS